MYSQTVMYAVTMAKTATFVKKAHISIKRMDKVCVGIAILLVTVQIVMSMGANHVKIATRVSLENVIESHSVTDKILIYWMQEILKKTVKFMFC